MANTGNIQNQVKNAFNNSDIPAKLTELGTKLDTLDNGGGAVITNIGATSTGRNRVANEVTLLSASQYLGADTNAIDEVTTGASATVYTGGFARMTASAGYNIRQSKTRGVYFPGKPQMPEITFSQFNHEPFIDKMVGYYSSNTADPYTSSYDGFMIRSKPDGPSSEYHVEIYNNGTQVNIGESDRSTWYDKLDGTGPSGIAYDWSKFTIIIADFLYLGGSGLRLFIKAGDTFVLFYSYNHAGLKAGTIMDCPNQPIRYEIRDDLGVGTGTLDMGCYAVSSEGSANTSVKAGSIGMSNLLINANTAGNRYAIKGIRLSDRRASVRIDQVTVLSSTNDPYFWELVLNPTIASTAPTWAGVTGYPVEGATADTVGNPSVNTVTLGTTLKCGYGQQRNVETGNLYNIEQRLGQKIDGTFDEIWVVVTPLSPNLDIRASIDFGIYQ